jgi:hypothetical protein
MVTQMIEPATLDLKIVRTIVPPVPRGSQGPRVAHSLHVYHSMAEKDSAEVGAYLRATTGPGNA